MRAVIKYLGKFVKDKVDHTHKLIEEISKLPSNILLGLDIKSEPVKSLRELMQGLVRVQNSRNNSKSFEAPLIDIYH